MKPSQHQVESVPRSAWYLLGVILLLAAGLRLTRLGLVEFQYDEATTARSALSIVRGGHLPTVGMISSEGPRNPPLMSYVLAPPFAITRDPRVAAGWVALLGVAAVGMTYWLGLAFFDWRVGALASALYAASPWAVFQSRKLWTQNLPLFTLLFVGSVLALVVRERPWALALALATVGFLISLHLGGLAFLFVLAAVLMLFHDRVRLAPLALGSALLLCIVAPYLVHDARCGWPSLRCFQNLPSGSAGFNPSALSMAARVASGLHLQDLAGTRHAAFSRWLPDLQWIDQLEIGLFWLGLLWTIARIVRQRLIQRQRLSLGNKARAVLLAWFLIPVALLTRRRPVQPHDFNLLYPVQHLIIALFLIDAATWVGSRLDRRSVTARRAVWGLCVLLVGAILVWQTVLHQALLTFVDRHPTPGGHGAPVKYAVKAAGHAAALAESEPASLVALVPGEDPGSKGPAAVFDVLLPPGKRRLIDGREALVLPDRPAIYLSHPGADGAMAFLPYLATELSGPLALRGGSDAAYRFFRWEPGPFSLDHTVPDRRHWIVGSDPGQTCSVDPLSYTWEGEPGPGRTIRWVTSWAIQGRPPEKTNLHWFNHLVDAQGTRWGQRDGVGVPVSDWRSGDTIITWFEIPISAQAPPPPYAVRTGLYTYPDVTNISLTDVAGNPAGQFLELGPIDAE